MKANWKFTFIIPLLFLFIGCVPTEEPGGIDEDNTQKFLGTWQVSDVPGRLNYSVKIIRNPLSENQLIIENYADLGEQAIGLVVINTIVIDQQDVGQGYQSEGTGEYINDSELKFEFFLDDGIDKELRKATFSK